METKSTVPAYVNDGFAIFSQFESINPALTGVSVDRNTFAMTRWNQPKDYTGPVLKFVTARAKDGAPVRTYKFIVGGEKGERVDLMVKRVKLNPEDEFPRNLYFIKNEDAAKFADESGIDV